jgi:hypothetical protein
MAPSDADGSAAGSTRFSFAMLAGVGRVLGSANVALSAKNLAGATAGEIVRVVGPLLGLDATAVVADDPGLNGAAVGLNSIALTLSLAPDVEDDPRTLGGF